MTLVAEEFGCKIADVNGVYVGGVQAGCIKSLRDDFLHTVGQFATFSRPIAREIALPSAEEINTLAHVVLVRPVRAHLNRYRRLIVSLCKSLRDVRR